MRRLTPLVLLLASLACETRGALVAPGDTTNRTTTTTLAPATKPQLIELATKLDRDTATATKTTRMTARIRVDAGKIAMQQRPPIDLALVVDTSGSMVGAPIDEARAAALTLLDGLRDGDRLTVVTFDTKAHVLVPPFVVDRSKLEPTRKALASMQARGTTDLAAGLALAVQQQMSSGLADSARRMVILGDGVPNDATPIPGQIAQAKSYGISISTLGFGLEYDETLLAQIAKDTGGRFHRIAPGEPIADAFSTEVMKIERTVASNVTVRMQPGPGVTIERVLGHGSAPDQSRAHTVALTDLAEGQHQDLFVEMTVSAHAMGATVELLDTAVTYDDRTANAGRLERTQFTAVPAGDEDTTTDPEIDREVALARVAAASIDAISMARAGDFKGADRLLETTLAQAKKLAGETDEPKLRAQVDELAALRKTLADDKKRWEKAEREATERSRQTAHKPGRNDSALGDPPSQNQLPMPAAAGRIAREPMPKDDLDTVKRVHSRAVETLQPH
jgi:Ca-activated chloride channel family protein